MSGSWVCGGRPGGRGRVWAWVIALGGDGGGLEG